VNARRRGIGAVAVALATVAVLAGLGACNVVVGAGDYKVGAPDDASTNHPPPNGDDDGSPPTSGDGGRGLRDGGGFIGNDAAVGTCGGDIPSSDPDFQKLVATCVEAVNCDYGLFPVPVSDCITKNFLQAIPALACLSTMADTSGTCAAYYGCQGDRTALPSDCPGVLTVDDATGFCTGNVATTCTGDMFYGSVQNCDKLNGTCGVHTDNAGSGEAVADCMVVPTCNDDDDGSYHCAGNKYYTCSGGVGYGKDCSAIDATCMDPGDGSGAGCYYNATSCSKAGQICSGTDVTLCSGGQQFDYQCGRAGLSCEEDDAGAVCLGAGCLPPSATDACTESCDGDSANVCVGGAAVTIDCTAYGFRTCDFEIENGYAFCIF
jgi:hypothetical protein